MLVLCGSLGLLGCAVRARRPDGPHREALEFVDAFSDIVVDCAGEHAPSGSSGAVVVAAEMSPIGEPPVIHDLGSSAGSEAVLACVREQSVAKLRNPSDAPAPYAQVRAPLPLVTSQVSFVFLTELASVGP